MYISDIVKNITFTIKNRIVFFFLNKLLKIIEVVLALLAS